MFDPGDFQLDDLDRVAEQSRQAVQRLSGVLGELKTIRGVGEAADGLIAAVVDGGGQIQEVTLDPRAMRLDSRSIAQAVTEAVRAAQQDARRRNDELLRDAMGGDLAFDPQNLDGVQSWLQDAARSMKDSWPH
ncbi:YbaB/EbfC family DNA-binding protein [Sphaerisporangium album]|uniref:YbaB/EbfC family DNA-binding protein n=1 Tax=Sphaerisporangium album TaxID=509200 RepID=A0A367FQH6_9ACTN|nr:YbaB/EbfC family nucleoid-associated protein [Sphaerisporangium album]RCG32638.1 YbaB/EbfC family DNA-binding protein [Sphaerisporangium album]